MSFLSKTCDNWTGRVHKKKAARSMNSANAKMEEARRYQSMLDGDMRRQFEALQNSFSNLLNVRRSNITAMENIEREHGNLGNRIRHYEGRLSNLSQNIETSTREYQENISRHEGDVTNFQSSTGRLQNLINSFRNDAPELSRAIENYQNLPTEFLSSYEQTRQRREELEGVNGSEAGSEIENFNSGVEALKNQRRQLEQAIRSGYSELEGRRGNLSVRRSELIQQISAHRRDQNRLLDRSSRYQMMRDNLEHIITNHRYEKSMYDQELARARGLGEQYESYRRNFENSNTELENLRTNAENHSRQAADIESKMQAALSEAGQHANWARGHAKKAERSSMIRMIGGALLGTLIPGIGTVIGAGLGGAVAHAASNWARLNKRLPELSSGNFTGGNFNYDNFANRNLSLNNASHLGRNAPISSGMLGNVPSVNIPELGGWQQVEHFNMPQLPDLHQLPRLEQALGRLTETGELNRLTLGLPQMTSRSGRKYNFAVLYKPEYLKKLKKVMKKASSVGSIYRRNMNSRSQNMQNQGLVAV